MILIINYFLWFTAIFIKLNRFKLLTNIIIKLKTNNLSIMIKVVLKHF
jgi:hypothetical protein